MMVIWRRVVAVAVVSLCKILEILKVEFDKSINLSVIFLRKFDVRLGQDFLVYISRGFNICFCKYIVFF